MGTVTNEKGEKKTERKRERIMEGKVKGPMLSVVVPIYNVEKYLRQCLRSITEQTLRDLELILVNDASPDGCIEICREWEERDERVRLIDKKRNEGVDKARFSGLAIARGKYVYFPDPDDWISGKDVFQKMVDKAEETGVDMVLMRQEVVYNSRGIPRKAMPGYTVGLVEMPRLREELWPSFFGEVYINAAMWGKLYRKSTIDRACLKPTGLRGGEDMMFNLKLWPYLRSVWFIDEVGYSFRTARKKEVYRPYVLDYIKKHFALRMEMIEKYDFVKAWDRARVAVMGGLREEISQRIRLKKESAEETVEWLRKELEEDVWRQATDIREREDVRNAPFTQALMRKDAEGCYRLVMEEVKKVSLKRRVKGWGYELLKRL